MGSRTSFLRYRLAVTGFAVGIMLLGAIPWIILAGVAGDVGTFAVFLLVVWGLFFLPVLLLGAKLARAAWRPVRTFSWRDMMRGPSPRGGQPTDDPHHGPRQHGDMHRDVIDAEVVEDQSRVR